MKPEIKTISKLVVIGIAALGIVFAPDARACGKQPREAGLAASNLFAPLLESETAPVPAAAGTALPGDQDRGETPSERRRASIVGMWIVKFYDINGVFYDRAIEQFYADGNEMTTDTAAAPVTDNTCYGVWEHAGNRTFKLRHIGWVFDPNGTFSGRFELTATLHVGEPGDTFTARYVADVRDLSGNIDPKQHAEGVLKGKRFKID
jgi:hypothetical protein